MSIVKDRNKRTEWFLKDRFGMFIHWGLYSIPARGEWVMTNEKKCQRKNTKCILMNSTPP